MSLLQNLQPQVTQQLQREACAAGTLDNTHLEHQHPGAVLSHIPWAGGDVGDADGALNANLLYPALDGLQRCHQRLVSGSLMESAWRAGALCILSMHFGQDPPEAR